MIENKPLADKLYYTIGEVATMFDVNTSLIRFWEKEFSVIKPKKNKKGNRLFTRADVENFHLIYHLVKERGYTLKGAQDQLRQNHDETVRKAQLVYTLKQVKGFLTNLKQGLIDGQEEPGQ